MHRATFSGRSRPGAVAPGPGRPRRPRARSPIATRRRTADEAADPEPHGRSGSRPTAPRRTSDAEPEVRRVSGGRPDPRWPRTRWAARRPAIAEGHGGPRVRATRPPDLSGRAGPPAERGHREAPSRPRRRAAGTGVAPGRTTSRNRGRETGTRGAAARQACRAARRRDSVSGRTVPHRPATSRRPATRGREGQRSCGWLGIAK